MARGIPLRDDFNVDRLRALGRSAGDAKQARRLLALSLIYDGGSRSEAARHANVNLQTVRDWVLRFNAEGPDGLIDGKSTGTPPRLNAARRTALARVVEDGPTPYLHGVVRWRLSDLVAWVQGKFGISLDQSTLSRTLRAMGYRKLSARPRHHAQDPEAVVAFKKTSPPEWRKSGTTSRRERPSKSGGRTRPGSARKTRSHGAGRNGERAPRRPTTNGPARPISSAPSVRPGASARPWCSPDATPTP